MIVTPERWYQGFWVLLSALGLTALYFVVKYAIVNAIAEAKARGLL